LEEINHRKSAYLQEALKGSEVHRIYGIDITTITTTTTTTTTTTIIISDM
jgi:hypothetical protein